MSTFLCEWDKKKISPLLEICWTPVQLMTLADTILSSRESKITFCLRKMAYLHSQKHWRKREVLFFFTASFLLSPLSGLNFHVVVVSSPTSALCLSFFLGCGIRNYSKIYKSFHRVLLRWGKRGRKKAETERWPLICSSPLLFLSEISEVTCWQQFPKKIQSRREGKTEEWKFQKDKTKLRKKMIQNRFENLM